MSYLHKKFLLNNRSGTKLYFKFAKDMPIFDYHCHLSEKAILENKRFENIYQLWLTEDHYKWRLMRNYGVDESYITGNKSDKEKFVKYCEVLSTAFGNPLYHWSQMELEKFFHCKLEINKENAEQIWLACNSFLENNSVTPQSLIETSNVKKIFTTNEIFDDLSVFDLIKEKKYNFEVCPAFRADKIINIECNQFNKFIDMLGSINCLDDLENVVEKRLNDFIKVGCVASDIALQKIELVYSKIEASNVFEKRRSNAELSDYEISVFKGYLTYFLMGLFAKYNIKCELHIGALRNNNDVLYEKLGPDCGCDCITEENSTNNLSKLFNKLLSESKLPSTIIFNLNPKMNVEFLALINCFQDSSLRGKIQYGPAWWFLDNKEGIIKNLKDLSSQGHLSISVGMLTDSRSFLSFERHQYFRRILCDYLGDLIERGEITNNLETVGSAVRDICYNNANKFFN